MLDIKLKLNENILHLLNPAHETISCMKVTDLSGKIVFDMNSNTSETSIDFQFPVIASGIYLINLLSGSGNVTGKFVVN